MRLEEAVEVWSKKLRSDGNLAQGDLCRLLHTAIKSRGRGGAKESSVPGKYAKISVSQLSIDVGPYVP